MAPDVRSYPIVSSETTPKQDTTSHINQNGLEKQSQSQPIRLNTSSLNSHQHTNMPHPEPYFAAGHPQRFMPNMPQRQHSQGQVFLQQRAPPLNPQAGYPPAFFHVPNQVMSSTHLSPSSPQYSVTQSSPEYAQRNTAYYHNHVPTSSNTQWFNYGQYYQVCDSPYARPQQVFGWPSQSEAYASRIGHPQLGSFPNLQNPPPIEQSMENLRLAAGHGLQNTSSAAPPTKATPRGPPRRPIQSGPALWVGNLPPKTTIHDLKELFSRGRETSIESVRLLSKTSCAFVNYRTHEACASAKEEFHDFPFGASKLSCKIAENMTDKSLDRASSGDNSSMQIGASSPSIEQHSSDLSPSSSYEPSQGTADLPAMSHAMPHFNAGAQDRYFIVKSLTLQDVEASTRSGLWATQAHNEDALNQAYQDKKFATNVYLIFSVNKSGEYFGYARMASPIPKSRLELPQTPSGDGDPTQATRSSYFSSATHRGSGQEQNAIVTPKTAQAPRGQIYEESERGIIFWEAKPNSPDQLSRNESNESKTEISTAKVDSGSEEGTVADAEQEAVRYEQTRSQLPLTPPLESAAETDLSGNFFRIDWIVIRRVPFFKCRGLRNAWNNNKKVKVARDGTELEPVVGRKLLELFQRLPI